MTSQLLTYGLGVVVVWLIAMRLRSVVVRQVLYLVASWLFYFSWASWLILILIFSSLMNYALGEWLKRKITAGRLWTGILLNLILLSSFKYLPLLGGAVQPASPLSALKRIALPLGVSFWTFQALSYLFEIYREEDLDPSLVEFCLYMGFWPTVLSGPICRLSSMLPQFRQSWNVSDDDLKIGVRRVSIGILMSVLASIMTVGLYPGTGVDAGFDAKGMQLGGTDVWFLIVAYGFQLYFNFCGYSHIVIGAARLFGIQLHENFNRPYLSTTPSVFWTRWHMSLSFWIRDYVFLPLATARAEVWWRNLSLVIAMFIFGVWHKGSVLFMIWGTYHGILLVFHRQWQQLRRAFGFEWSGGFATAISWLLTFSAVCVGYIFFRANDLGQALRLLKALVSFGTYGHLGFDSSFYVMTLAAFVGYFAVLGADAVLDHWDSDVTETRSRSGMKLLLSKLADERWVWISPVVIVLALYLSLIFHPGHINSGPVMYALF